MIISRLLNRLPTVSFAGFDVALMQFGWYRRLCGGLYVKMQGRWYGCSPIIVLGDGSRVLRRCDAHGGSFHETFNGIEKLEEHA